jgi:hypothetical protein
MGMVMRYAAVAVLSSLMVLSVAFAESVDDFLTNLKHDDPEIRAKAAYELGCG